MEIIILTPVFNDWASLQVLVGEIHSCLCAKFTTIHVIAINDCSDEGFPDDFIIPEGILLTIIDLAVNVGHQRAMTIGLCYLSEYQHQSAHIIIMDSDGEDKPSDILSLITMAEKEDKMQVIFAQRIKRSETIRFKLFYLLYKILFKFLTGNEIKFGNFSCLPVSFVPQVINNPNFWNHYSASILKANMPYTYVKTERGKRYSGISQMKFNNLILHGLSSLSIYLDIIVLRLLKFTFFAILAVFIALFALIYVKYFTDLAIPGWTSLLFSIS